jgi:hypothetical protein
MLQNELNSFAYRRKYKGFDLALTRELDKSKYLSFVPNNNFYRAKYRYQLLIIDFSRLQINYDVTSVGDTPNLPIPKYQYSNSFSVTPLVNIK